jgi:hypothetical protein
VAASPGLRIKYSATAVGLAPVEDLAIIHYACSTPNRHLGRVSRASCPALANHSPAPRLVHRHRDAPSRVPPHYEGGALAERWRVCRDHGERGVVVVVCRAANAGTDQVCLQST